MIGGPGMYIAPVSNQPPVKPINLSSKPLKSFNWVKIAPMKAKETVWSDIDDTAIHQKLKKGVYSDFEELFAARETKAADSNSQEKLDAGPKEITFLDSKRSQNVNIMLKAIKLEPTSIKKAILTVNLITLPRFVLTELLKLIPTEDEMIAVKQYENNIRSLASAERFMYEISEISRYEQKLKAMFFKASFSEYQEDAESMINALMKASTEILEGNKFKELLKVILALGNYLNAGQRGGAYGFKIGSLLKMIDTRSTIATRKHTLLHYLTELVDKEFPQIIGFQNQLAHVEDGAKVGIPQIRSAMVAIRDNLKLLKMLLDDMGKTSEKGLEKKSSGGSILSSTSTNSASLSQKFTEVMEHFYIETQKIYDKLEEHFKDSEKEFEKAVTLYGEDAKNCTPEEFFGIFAKFIQSYLASKADNEAALAKDIADKKRDDAKREQDETRRKKKEEATPRAKEGGLDDLISSIRTGKAFGGTNDAAAGRARRMKNASPVPIKKPGYDGSEKDKGTLELGAVGRLRHHREISGKSGGVIVKLKGAEMGGVLVKDGLRKGPVVDSNKVVDVQGRLKGVGRVESPSDVRRKFEEHSKQ